MKHNTIRVLHVVGGMNRGGVETWLFHVLRNIDRDKYQMDFLVHTTEPCAYDEEIRGLGSKILPCLHPRKPLQYARHFKRLLAEHGPYDVVHSHVHHFSGFVLWLAKRQRVPVRIAHSHSDTAQLHKRRPIHRYAYYEFMRMLLSVAATHKIGVSSEACRALFGNNSSARTLYCGIDLSPFAKLVDQKSLRSKLQVPERSFIIGHVGRFSAPKNHDFIIEIFAEVVNQNQDAFLLLVGDGSECERIQKKVESLGLKECVGFAGLRDDVPEILLGAIDVFLFPSLHEGLPLALMEVQAAGVPMVISNIITEETDIVTQGVRRLPLTAPPETWARNVLSFRDYRSDSRTSSSLKLVRASCFNIVNSINRLISLYQ